MRYVDTTTDDERKLKEWLIGELIDAEFVAIRTGFTSLRGVSLVIDHLKAILERGGRVEIVAGGADEQPDSAALLMLEKLTNEYPKLASVRVVTDPDIFQNAKTYYVRSADGRTRAWVGSANLTYGGLASNHEAVVMFDADDPEDLKAAVLGGIQAYATGRWAEQLTIDVVRRLEARKVATRGPRSWAMASLSATERLEDLLQPTMDEIDAVATRVSRDDVGIGVPTGFTDLDRFTGGLHPGQLVVVAGRPSAGTSTLLMDFARNCSIKHGMTSVMFSMQTRREDLSMRLLSAESRIRLTDMRGGRMSDEDWTRLAKRMTEISDLPLLFNCSPTAHVDALYANIVKLAAAEQPKAIFIDSLNSITATVEPGASREREVSSIVRQLKMLALQLEVPVVLAAELGRGVESRMDMKPGLGDLRESDTTSQVADLVILLHRPDLYERDHVRAGEADLILAKNRFGPPATVTVAHQLHYSRFTDMAQA